MWKYLQLKISDRKPLVESNFIMYQVLLRRSLLIQHILKRM